jgi:NADH-quinone oxidoreductase subunit G
MPDGDGVTLTIEGHRVTVPKGTLVVEAAKLVGVEIPVFCYHHKMAPVGACRLCLVEISPGPPKPTTGCTTPVAEGMAVKVSSPLAVAARADILEFELVNHPLDCPVCDKGGECPLQDYTFRHAYPISRIDGPRLHFKKPIQLSDKIALDRERCVLCYRCTRYYDEIAWEQELTTDQRGVHSYITSQFDRPLQSIFSGNIIDLCPVGALTSRVWRFESRPWDMHHVESVCSRCSVGCNVMLWERRKQLVRVTSHENDQIDDGWICDRGRFEYTQVNDRNRLRVPQVGGADASWEDAVAAAVDGLAAGQGARLGICVPQDVSNEEAYLLTRLLAGPWKGARVRVERRTALPAPEGETLRIADLDRARAIVVIASDTRDDVPIINLRIKKAVSKLGARLVVVHPGDLDLDRHAETIHVRPKPGETPAAVRKLASHPALKEGPVAILWGDGRGSEDAEALGDAVAELAKKVKASVLPLYRGTNERGLLAVGIDGRDSLDGVRALLCWGSPPEGGIPGSAKFVAVWSILLQDGHGRPSVVLPDISFAERQGSYTNVEGTVQFIRPAVAVEPPMRESWEVLAEIGQRLGAETDYSGVFAIQRELAAEYPVLAGAAQSPSPEPAATPVLYGPARP